MATKKNITIKKKDGREYSYYRITRTIGHEYKDGKKVPIKKQFIGTSKGNAQKKYEEWMLATALSKSSVVDSNKSLREVVAFYRDNILIAGSKYAESTKKQYSEAINAFMKADTTGLFNKPIQNVAPVDIQVAYNNYNCTLSAMQNVNKFLRGFISWAVLNKYCTDILSPVVIPKKPYTKKKDGIVVWSEQEQEAIVSNLNGYHHRFLVILLLYSGLRISEALGLKYSDFKNGFLNVSRQYYRGEEKEPKYNSTRKIPIHPVVAEELELHKTTHEHISEYVFTTPEGRMLDYTNVKRSLRRFYASHNFPYKSPHTYRATFCTNLCRAGVPLQTASTLMGHKSIEVTAKFYAFVSEAEKELAINKLPRLDVNQT